MAGVESVESEMELPFAGLRQLCLPTPQSEAPATAFGLSSGPGRTASWSGWRYSVC